MMRPRCVIRVGEYSFDFVNELELSSAWKNVTDTGFLRIPRKLLLRGESIAAGDNSLFKRGDSVEVSLGYYPELVSVFMGYVSDILPGSPFELRIEDSAFLFKQSSITKSYASITLKQLLEDLCPIPFEALDADLGAFRITRANFAQVVRELKESYGLICWVRNGTLYAGLAYRPELMVEHVIDVQSQVIGDDLIYQREEDIRVKVKAISIQPDNSRIEVEVGDPDGEERTLNYYNLTMADLIATAEREIPKLKYTGYRGTFATFGAPTIDHGDSVEIQDLKTPERAGSYLVDEVITSQGMAGFRQRVTLGPKLSA